MHKRTSVTGAAFLIGAAATVVFANFAAAQTPDFSGTQLFWRVEATLASGAEPDAALLDSLFQTVAYAALEQRERRRARLTSAFRLAFLPRLSQNDDSLRVADPWVQSIVPHLRRARALRPQLDALVERLRNDSLFRAADQLARGLLPRAARTRPEIPAVAFILFAPDGRGYPHLVIADLLRTYDLHDARRFFAHEFHHFHRHALGAGAGALPAKLRLLAAVVGNLEFEGIADRLDKADIPRSSNAEPQREPRPDSARAAYEARYRDEYNRGPAWVRYLDSTLLHLPSDSAALANTARILSQSLPDGGRILGAYMAGTIERILGRDALAEVVGDMRQFFHTYSAAARRCAPACVAYSPRALGIVDQLAGERAAEPRAGR